MLRRKYLSNRYYSAVETVIEIEDETPDADGDSDPAIDPRELDERTTTRGSYSPSSFSSSPSSSSSDSEIDPNQLDNITRKYPNDEDDSSDDDSEEICIKCLDLRTLPTSKGSRKDAEVLRCEEHRPHDQPLLPPSKVKGREVLMLPSSLPKRGSSSERDYEIGHTSGTNIKIEQRLQRKGFM